MSLPAYLLKGEVNTLLRSALVELKPSSVFLLCDSNTLKHCQPVLEALRADFDWSVIHIEAGEEFKTLSSANSVWTRLISEKADRNSVLISLGGGLITDLGGFAASCYKRGMKSILIPSSLLAMVDASLGSKTGVNLASVKNAIGTFSDPDFVIVDPVFLNSLPDRQWLNGYAEIVKHSLLISESELENTVPIRRDSIDERIVKSLEFKWSVVEKDPTEQGIRKSLNFGHTIGHAIESLSMGALFHGEAIMHGMAIELRLSELELGLDKRVRLTIEDTIKANYPSLPDIELEDVLSLIQNDKKNTAGRTSFTLLESRGIHKLMLRFLRTD